MVRPGALAQRLIRRRKLSIQCKDVVEVLRRKKDPMTTAAAIDRLVHHSMILELNVPSVRLEEANPQREALN